MDTFWILTRTEFHPEAPEETEAAGLSLEPGTSAAQPLTTYFITWEVSQQLYNAVMEAELPVAQSPHHAVLPGPWAHFQDTHHLPQ